MPSSRPLPRWSVLAAALLALAPAGCRTRRVAPDEIVLLNEAPAGRIDPRYAATNWEQRVSHLVAPGLIDLRERGLGPTPGLAESLAPEDEVTWKARLRDGLRFSDGTSVTADDVKYTFDSVRDPLLASPYRQAWDEVLVSVEVVDPRTVRFHLRRPRAPLKTDLDFGIISRAAALPLDEAVRAAARAGQRPPAFDPVHEIVGAGPYVVAARDPDAVVLSRNPHAAVPPATERLVVRTIRDDNSRILALVGGSADAILNVVTPLVVSTLQANPRLQVDPGPSATLTYLGINTADAILGKRAVRQALACAIDRDRLVRAKFEGRARVAASPLDAGNEFFAADLTPWPYDPARARRLLDEAGFPDPPGPEPRFRLTWKSSSNQFRVALAHAMARQLAEIGIDVEVRPLDFGVLMDDLRKGNFQLFTLQRTDMVEPDMLRPLFHSTRIPTAQNRYEGHNRFRYANPALDALLDRAAVDMDPAERKGIYGKIQKLLAEELPLLPLWHEDNVVVHGRGLEGVDVLKTGRLEGFLFARKEGAR